jgi:Domain of Unknown Function (DUF1080)
MINKSLFATALAAGLLLAQPPAGGPPPQGGPPRGPGGAPRGPRGIPGPEAVPLDDRTGFESIFDGTLKGWDGDPDFWRAENNTIVGETTKEKPLKVNTFLIWQGGEPGDFELKVDYRMNNTNSGVQYRSVLVPEFGKWALKGYQADIDFQNTFSGQLYEERGRGFLALRGQMATLKEGETKGKIIGAIHGSDELKGYLKINDWNTMHIIARGNMLTHVVNGKVMAVFIDEDPKNRMMKGLLGFQIHVGAPMKIEFRNIAIKKL